MNKGIKIKVRSPRVVNVDNVPSENVALLRESEKLCRADEMDRFINCNDYNSDFCRHECEHGPKETIVDEFNSEQSVILPKL